MNVTSITSKNLLQQWLAYAEGLLDARQLRELIKQSKKKAK
jgi:hypothetical protein